MRAQGQRGQRQGGGGWGGEEWKAGVERVLLPPALRAQGPNLQAKGKRKGGGKRILCVSDR